MSEFTRRTFLKTGSAAVVAAGALSAVPALPAAVNAFDTTAPVDAGAAESADADADAGAPSLAEPLIAHVRDLATGEIGLFTGTREITVLDPSLAARLLRSIR